MPHLTAEPHTPRLPAAAPECLGPPLKGSEPPTGISQIKQNTALLRTPWADLCHSLGLSIAATNPSSISVVFLSPFAFDDGLVLKGKRRALSSSLFPFSDGVIKLIYSEIVFFFPPIVAYFVFFSLYHLAF